MTLEPRVLQELGSLCAFLEHSPDAVFVSDRQNRIVVWNLAIQRLLGFTPEEATGMACSALTEGCDVWGNRYCTEHCPVKEMAGRQEPIRRFALRVRTRTQGPIPVELTVLQLQAGPGSAFYLMHILKPAHNAAQAPEEEAAPPRAALTAARESTDARARRLTHREVEILGLMAAGRMTGEIASHLCLSTVTVRNHTQNILDKLEVHSKAEAVAFAFQKGLM